MTNDFWQIFPQKKKNLTCKKLCNTQANFTYGIIYIYIYVVNSVTGQY